MRIYIFSKSILFFTFLVSASTFFAQEIKVSGVIKDSIGNPLEMANVIALDKATNKVASYSITNSKGEYRLFLESENTYQLKISFLGNKTINSTLKIANNDVIKNFTLFDDETLLNEVAITYEMPIVIKGDTISYSADAFSNGTERKLGDVLKKLPGVEINSDGLIEVEGNQVRKVMVEGKDFFDGDSKLAVENIPSDAIDKIEVIKNFTEVEQLRSVTNNMDNYAINIKLKEGKKKFWFGDITAGIGFDERYLTNPKLFYYSPKKSVNIITNVNNIGELPFTRRDFFRFTGGFKNLTSGSGTSLNLTTGNLGFSILKDDKAQEINTSFGAANFSYSPTKNWDLSGFFIFSDTKTAMSEITSFNYLDGSIENTESITEQKNKLGLAKLSSLYKPNKDFQLDYDAFFKLSKQTENSNLISRFLDQENSIKEQLDDSPFSIDQNLNAYLTLNDKNILSAEVQYLWSKEYPFYNATFLDLGNNPTTEELPLSTLFPINVNQNDYSLNQDKFIQTNKFEIKTDYYYIINKKSSLNSTVGSILSSQKFDSSLFQVLDDTTLNDFEDPEFNNDVTYKFKDLYAGVHYRVALGKFTFNTGINLHNFDTKNEQLNIVTSTNEVKLLPDFLAILQLKKSESIRFNYSLTAQYPDINVLAEGYVLNNYNSLFKGNLAIKEGLHENYKLFYSSFSLFNYTNILATLSYSKKKDPIKSQIIFIQNNQISTPINSTRADEIFSGSFNYGRTFTGKYKVGLKARASHSSLYNVNDIELAKTEEIKQSYTASVATNFKNGPNFEIGYNKLINIYNLDISSNTYYTDEPFANMSYYFLEGLKLNIDYSYYKYADKEYTLNTYSFLNSNISYQKDGGRWEYRIDATNILNTKSINQDNFTDIYSSTSQYFVQPRYVVFSLKYTI